MDSRTIAGLVLFLLASTALARPQAGKPEWVARSDAHAQVLLELLARFDPEDASALGMAGRRTSARICASSWTPWRRESRTPRARSATCCTGWTRPR